MIINKITKARSILICEHPFFASLLLPMPMIEDSSIESMETDGQSIRYNPTWSESLTLPEIIFVLGHETLHCVFDHMGRRGGRGPNRWNQAADFIINEILVNEKTGSMPKLGLYDPILTAKGGNTAEGVYNLLPEENEKNQAGSKGGALDHVHDAGTNNGTESTDPAKMAQASADLKVRVIAAKNTAKMQGKMSAGLERLIDDLVKPKVDWRDALRKFISVSAKIDFSFARPKRRFLAEDLYLPSLIGNTMGDIVIPFDCSGSTFDGKTLALFATELNAIKEDLKPRSLKIAYFDTEVLRVDEYGPDDEITFKPIGGGGTDFSKVIEYINGMEEEPTCVVFLTDMQCDDYGDAPSYPVLWCAPMSISDDWKNVPYGELLEVENEKS